MRGPFHLRVAFPAKEIALSGKQEFILSGMRLMAHQALAVLDRLVDRGREKHGPVMAVEAYILPICHQKLLVVGAVRRVTCGAHPDTHGGMYCRGVKIFFLVAVVAQFRSPGIKQFAVVRLVGVVT
jgi:hypothetical protein